MAITAILDLQLKADSLESAYQAVHETLTATRARPGCLEVTVLIDSVDPAHVVVYERWESMDHDRAYRAWRTTPEGASELGPFLTAPPKLNHFTIAEDV